MLVLYGINHLLFEKELFFNEILSLAGFLIFVKYSFKKNFKIQIPKLDIFRLLLFFWGLCGFYVLISVFFKTNWYFYFRHFVFFYSTFTFFITFFWKDQFLLFMQKIRKKFTLLILLLIPAYPPTYEGRFLDRFSGSVFFPFFFKRLHFLAYFLLLILNFIYAYFFQSFTGTIMAILVFIILIIPSYSLFRLLFFTAFISFVMLFIYLSPNLAKYSEGAKGSRLFGNQERVYQSSKILAADPNSSWRMVYWYRIVVENFPENLIGIGFGTPYLPYVEGRDTADSNYDDKYDAHLTGVHNSYITMFARLGILAILFFFALYTTILKEFYCFKKYYTDNNHIVFFIGFFAISLIALFNPVLETPTYSGIYWFFLGLVAKSIHERRLTNENPPNT
jgi:hypothetical protein